MIPVMPLGRYSGLASWLEGPIGRLETRDKVRQMLDFVNNDAL